MDVNGIVQRWWNSLPEVNGRKVYNPEGVPVDTIDELLRGTEDFLRESGMTGRRDDKENGYAEYVREFPFNDPRD